MLKAIREKYNFIPSKANDILNEHNDQKAYSIEKDADTPWLNHNSIPLNCKFRDARLRNKAVINSKRANYFYRKHRD